MGIDVREGREGKKNIKALLDFILSKSQTLKFKLKLTLINSVYMFTCELFFQEVI